jgi:hypothetical protein
MLQTVLSEQEFTAAASQLEDWSTAKDFLESVANGCRPEVVFVTEGCVAKVMSATTVALCRLHAMHGWVVQQAVLLP